eukprot:Phypoly_transcript_04356.p1 GENE.Phypoly_transcript_04356~~Phypoly_transcript_04356.p1  ORF type:complete len:530 (+),score=142.32 Phypoly_transcript_04356:111-1700(+)
MAKKLRVQDAIIVDEADQAQGDAYEQLEEIDLGEKNTNDYIANNNDHNYSPKRPNSPNNNYINHEQENSPQRNNSPITTSRYYEDDGYEREDEREEKINEREERREQDDEEDIDFGVLIVEFSQLTGEEDQGKILAVLEKHNWNLEKSVSSFLDEQDSRYFYQPTYNPSPYHTTTTTSSHYATATDYNSRDEGATSQIGTFDDNDENDNASTYANPDTRQDVSDESDDEAYTKSYGLPSTTSNNERFDHTEYTAFSDTIDDHIENKDAESDRKLGEKTFVSPYDKVYHSNTTTSTNNDYYDDDENDNEKNDNNNNNKNDNNNNNTNNNNNNNSNYYNDNNKYSIYTTNNYTTSSNSNFNYEYEYNKTFNNNNNNSNNDNNNNDSNNNNNFNYEYEYNKTFNNFKTKIPSISDSGNTIGEDYNHGLEYNTKYCCKLAVIGSGWSNTSSVIPGRTSLKLLCVDQLSGRIVTHEKLIELLHLCDLIDCYAFHQLIFGTAARCYYTLRTLPSYQKLSEATQSRIQDFMTDGWD